MNIKETREQGQRDYIEQRLIKKWKPKTINITKRIFPPKTLTKARESICRGLERSAG